MIYHHNLCYIIKLFDLSSKFVIYHQKPWSVVEVYDLPSHAKLLASSPACNVQAFSAEKAFGLQFHVEQTSETVPQWACVPEYKSALENTLGQNALEKFKKDVEENLNTFNKSAKIIYQNFKKVI